MRVFKLYFDKDKEEKWLNDMCRQGKALQKFFLGVQTFTPCEKGAYYYRIDLLYNWKGKREDYQNLMEENGIEYVCQWYRWVWLRKKVTDGPFDLYTDRESKIDQYKRIKRLFTVGFLLESLSILILAFEWRMHLSMELANIIFMIFAALLALVFLFMIIKCNRKIKKLNL